MIKFLQHSSNKYPPRTYENASADCTIAFAFDFNTPGEKLTYDAVTSQGKLYIPVNPFNSLSYGKISNNAAKIAELKCHTLNIAGNGLYTTIKHGHDQSMVDGFVYDYLDNLVDMLKEKNTSIALIRSGGQSGFDEAGLKAAVKLGIPALCLCPQGWKFMNEKGETICDEQKFKERFKGCLVL